MCQVSSAHRRVLWQMFPMKNAENVVIDGAQVSDAVAGKLLSLDQLTLLNVGRHATTLRNAA